MNNTQKPSFKAEMKFSSPLIVGIWGGIILSINFLFIIISCSGSTGDWNLCSTSTVLPDELKLTTLTIEKGWLLFWMFFHPVYFFIVTTILYIVSDPLVRFRIIRRNFLFTSGIYFLFILFTQALGIWHGEGTYMFLAPFVLLIYSIGSVLFGVLVGIVIRFLLPSNATTYLTKKSSITSLIVFILVNLFIISNGVLAVASHQKDLERAQKDLERAHETVNQIRASIALGDLKEIEMPFPFMHKPLWWSLDMSFKDGIVIAPEEGEGDFCVYGATCIVIAPEEGEGDFMVQLVASIEDSDPNWDVSFRKSAPRDSSDLLTSYTLRRDDYSQLYIVSTPQRLYIQLSSLPSERMGLGTVQSIPFHITVEAMGTVKKISGKQSFFSETVFERSYTVEIRRVL